MLGLMILLVVIIYMTIWAGVVILSYRLTFKVTASKKKSYFVSTVFFLMMYLIPFWDLIPTLVMHKYYCTTEAGFFVYKTPEEWIAENPGEIDKLKMSLKPQALKDSDVAAKEVDRTGVTQRFYLDVYREHVFLTLGKTEKRFVDASNNELIAKTTNFILGSEKASVVSGGSIESMRQAISFFIFGKGQCGMYEIASREGVYSGDDEFSNFIYQFWKYGELK